MVPLFLLISLVTPVISHAAETEPVATQPSFFSRIQESIAYFFTFGTEQKIEKLDTLAEKRLNLAQDMTEQDTDANIQEPLQNYLELKDKQNNLLKKIDNNQVLNQVQERTIAQQQVMEQLKNRIDVNGKEGVMQVQEQVVNQVAERIIEKNGTEGTTEFFQKVEHVWAPGTAPKAGESANGNAGVVIEGGTMQFAPGTEGTGTAGPDIQTTVIKSDGGAGQQNNNSGPGQVIENTVDTNGQKP